MTSFRLRPLALALALAGGTLALQAGCEETTSSSSNAAPATDPDAPRTRSSTLGKAMDAAERTEREIEEYQQQVQEEADRVFERGGPPTTDPSAGDGSGG